MHLPPGKGILGQWAKLASKAAFRKGKAFYCGYRNEISPGMWAGGIVGLKSILNAKSRTEALGIMDKLSELGYICYELDEKTKKLTYCIKDLPTIFDRFCILQCSDSSVEEYLINSTKRLSFSAMYIQKIDRSAEQEITTTLKQIQFRIALCL